MKPGCANRGGDGRLSVSQAPPRSRRPRCLGCILRAAFTNQAESLLRGGVCPGGWAPTHPRTPGVLRCRTLTVLMTVESHNIQLATWKQTLGGLSVSLHVFILGNLCAQSLSHVDSATPWSVAPQAPLSMGFPRQGYWSGLPFPSPGDLPDPGIEPQSLTCPALARRVLYH